uniref:Uncharacterized protein n=1 Tax=Arundo donax TaxID=35708 RepID=A0A0A9E8A4_ARUDO
MLESTSLIRCSSTDNYMSPCHEQLLGAISKYLLHRERMKASIQTTH